MSSDLVGSKSLEVLKKEVFGEVYFFQELCDVRVYKERILVIDLKVSGFAIGIDVLSESNVNLVSRNKSTSALIKRFFDFTIVDDYKFTVMKNGVISSKYLKKALVCQDNPSLKDIVLTLSRVIEQAIHEVMSYSKLNNISMSVDTLRDNVTATLNDIAYSVFLPSMIDFYKKHHLDMMSSLDKIIKNNMSLARFGDGEINLILDVTQNHYFQKNSDELNYSLQKIIDYCYGDGMLVTIPAIAMHRPWWKKYWKKNWSLLSAYLSSSKYKYGDTAITRPEFFTIYKDKAVTKWKELWNNKSVCFITGEGSRFDVEHELFDNLKYKRTIRSLPVNAFEDLENIVNEIERTEKQDMYLIALGPSGTVLASRLHQRGYRSLDIGHITNSYDHVFNGKEIPEKIPHKNT